MFFPVYGMLLTCSPIVWTPKGLDLYSTESPNLQSQMTKAFTQTRKHTNADADLVPIIPYYPHIDVCLRSFSRQQPLACWNIYIIARHQEIRLRLYISIRIKCARFFLQHPRALKNCIVKGLQSKRWTLFGDANSFFNEHWATYISHMCQLDLGLQTWEFDPGGDL